MNLIFAFLLSTFFTLAAIAETPTFPHFSKPIDLDQLKSQCMESLSKPKGKFDSGKLKKLCDQVLLSPTCLSHEKTPIFHTHHSGKTHLEGKKILVFSLIHGDEEESIAVARTWMLRLLDLESRNHWRIVPVLNPDGWKRKTRVNARGVDLNRNFPTKDWDELALKYWREKTGSDKRRYPGESGGSEVETQCAITHIQEYNPDFIISIHTPYAILDFDGPKQNFPKYSLPWRSLGNFPGSLGRYMWKDQKKPVMTIELSGTEDLSKIKDFEYLQDISGSVAIESDRKLKGIPSKKE